MQRISSQESRGDSRDNDGLLKLPVSQHVNDMFLTTLSISSFVLLYCWWTKSRSLLIARKITYKAICRLCFTLNRSKVWFWFFVFSISFGHLIWVHQVRYAATSYAMKAWRWEPNFCVANLYRDPDARRQNPTKRCCQGLKKTHVLWAGYENGVRSNFILRWLRWHICFRNEDWMSKWLLLGNIDIHGLLDCR